MGRIVVLLTPIPAPAFARGRLFPRQGGRGGLQAEFAELLGGFELVVDLGVGCSALHCGEEEVGDGFAVVGDV